MVQAATGSQAKQGDDEMNMGRGTLDVGRRRHTGQHEDGEKHTVAKRLPQRDHVENPSAPSVSSG